MAEKGRPLPKFGEWNVNDPSSADGYTVIFNKARNDKKVGNANSPPKDSHKHKKEIVLGQPHSQKKWFCCISVAHVE